MSAARRSLLPVGVFTASYLVLATLTAFSRGNLEFVFYVAVLVPLAGAVWVVDRRVGLSHGALWCLSVWGLAHMLGGLLPVPATWPIAGSTPVLYSLWLVPRYLKYDQLTHAFGFGVTTWVCWQALRASIGGPRALPTVGRMVLCAAAGLGFGALNEVIEFAATLALPETNVGGYMNTGWDLVSNLVGAVVAASVIYLGSSRT